MSFRVLHVIGGSKFGGIVPYVAALVAMAREHGGDATVLATDQRIVQYYKDRGIDVVEIGGIDRPINPVRDCVGLTRLVRYLRSNPFTIVHTHTSKGGFIGRLAARLANVSMNIHTNQGYAFADYATNALSRMLFLRAEQLASHWCDFIITVNDDDHRKSIDHRIVAGDKVALVRNGISLEFADRELSVDPTAVLRELNIDRANPVVGFVGRLAPQKGLTFFIDAIPSILARFPKCQFVIVGSGEQEQDLRQRAADAGVAGQIRFTGFRADSYRIMRIMNVLVMPSLWEGMPITLLEGMAARLPIVATRIKGIADICESSPDAIALIEPANSAAIAEAVIRILSDPAMAQRLGSAARALVERRFSDRQMIDSTWSIYQTVARHKGIVLTSSSALASMRTA